MVQAAQGLVDFFCNNLSQFSLFWVLTGISPPCFRAEKKICPFGALLLCCELTRQAHFFHSFRLQFWTSSVSAHVRAQNIQFIIAQKFNSQCALPRRRSRPRMGLFLQTRGGTNILGQRILITTLEPSPPHADLTVKQFSYKLRQQHRTSLENISHE